MPSNMARAAHDTWLEHVIERAASALGRCGSGSAAALLLLAVSFWLGVMACHAHGGGDGAGGQSGDEGRKVRSGWLGTGGVATDLSAARP
jgi:hypothetical protein